MIVNCFHQSVIIFLLANISPPHTLTTSIKLNIPVNSIFVNISHVFIYGMDLRAFH